VRSSIELEDLGWGHLVCLVIARRVSRPCSSRQSYRLTAITDSIIFVLMVSASVAFARNAFSGPPPATPGVDPPGRRPTPSNPCSQILWMHWELVVKQNARPMSLGDAGVFLAWIILILGFALRPHVEPTSRNISALGTLDLALTSNGRSVPVSVSLSHPMAVPGP